MIAQQSMAKHKQKVKVWDPVVRIGHWLLVLAFFTAYFSEDDYLSLHVAAGYVVATIVLIRLVWGFVGSRHARFANFVYTPTAIVAYLRQLRQGEPPHYIGHNPAGGAMVMALLFCLAVTSVTGLKLYAIEKNAGPWVWFAAALTTTDRNIQPDSSHSLAPSPLSKLRAVDKESEEIWEELHELFANLTLALAMLHIAAVLHATLKEKQALIKTMLSGVKEIDDSYR